MSETEKPAGLALLRVPFTANQISKLPKPSKKQTEELKADFRKGQRCQVCGGWHQADVVHLDYVGHAALTDRLLDVDPLWSWEPMGFAEDGTPAFDRSGGLWIKLTVCGVTRLGYGAADGKNGGDAVKEIIGDALRNAAMRFGAALDLWHKGDLHAEESAPVEKSSETVARDMASANITPTADASSRVLIERKPIVERVASEVIDCFEANSVPTALEVIEEANLDADEKVFLWTFLDSKQRSALKREAKTRQDTKNLRETVPLQA